MTVIVDEFEVADPPGAWARAGFSVGSDAVCRIGGVGIRLVGRGRGAAPAVTSDTGTGIVGWSLRGLPPDGPLDDLDGIPTTRSRPGGDIGPRSRPGGDIGPRSRPGGDIGPTSVAVTAAPAIHPNGVIAIDHVVLLSPDLNRTVESLATVGVDPRRERMSELGGQPIRQIFFRFGEVIVEVVGPPETAGVGPSTLWGITYVVADIDVTASFFGDHTTPVKDAVQPGRRITTLRHDELGMSVRSAMISAPILGA
jgi:hypothetical protein